MNAFLLLVYMLTLQGEQVAFSLDTYPSASECEQAVPAARALVLRSQHALAAYGVVCVPLSTPVGV